MFTSLYRYFNKDDVLLYVGISKHPVTRLRQHISNKDWIKETTNVTLEQFETRELALLAEEWAIKSENPKYNKQHNLFINKYEQRLSEELLSKSYSTDYEIAKLEWELACVCESDYTCACGKTPIKRLCFLYNNTTNKYCIVGSSCVKKYLYIDTKHYFQSIEALKTGKLIDKKYLPFVLSKVYLTEWEHKFYHNMYDFKRISIKQKEIINRINTKILNVVTNVHIMLNNL